jgi:hypothetical protein
MSIASWACVFANAVDHDCRNEARPYLRRAENGVPLTQKERRVKGSHTDRSPDLTRQSIRPLIANLCITPVPNDSTTQIQASVPDRHQTKHHSARTSIGAVAILPTVPTAEGGTCATGCFDYHTKLITPTTSWAYYQIPWSQLMQGGWGTAASFSAASILYLEFEIGACPSFDLYIDDLGFY